ncbi:hypothetical protein AB0K89_28340 [Streptomyces cinnamoneus]|uniref:hypothetical protein n=1 Tax=Streptomyces cinnamoneus TaxID=53446 RepID=UPI00343A0AFF
MTHPDAEAQAFQALLDNQSVVDTGALRRAQAALRRDLAAPPPTSLVSGAPPTPAMPVARTAQPQRRQHAQPRHRHRGDRAQPRIRLPCWRS